MSLVHLSITHLAHFVLVAECGGYRAASQRANRSPSALSLSIREAECRLNQPLFERGARSVLTPFGRECLPLARALVQHHERVCTAMGQLAQGLSGSLRVASVVTAVSHWLPELVERYIELYPDVTVTLLDDITPHIERMVLAEEVDFGICGEVLSNDNLQFEPLVTDVFGLVCPRDHPLATAEKLRWSCLEGLPLIGSTAHRTLHSLPEAEPLRRAKLFTSHMITLLSMMKRGLGVTVLPKLGVPRDADWLAFVPLYAPRLCRDLGIVKLATRTLSPAAAAMEALLRDNCS